MTDQGKHAHITRLLEIYQRNLRNLEQQAANYGGEELAPIHLMSQLTQTREKIAELEDQLGNSSPAPAIKAATLGQQNTQSTPVTPPVEPVQVEIDFQPTPDGAQITWSNYRVIGRELTAFETPFKHGVLPLIIRALDVLQYPNYPDPVGEMQTTLFTFSQQEQELLMAYGLWRDGRIDANAAAIVGQHMFDGLGTAGRGVLKAIRNFGLGQGEPISYIFRFPANAISLAALPWELLWDSQKNEPIFLRSDIVDSIERYVVLDAPVHPPISAGETLHILALSPRYNIPDTLRATERAGRLKTWDKLRATGKITYEEISPLTIEALNDYLLDAPRHPDIIHYYGHGTYRDGKGYLLFDDTTNGKQMVSTEKLRQVFGGARLVVLCACESAMVDDVGGLLTGIAPAVSLDTTAVVAMQLTVEVKAASRFAQVFYDQLLSRGKTLQDSVARARQILFTEGYGWYVPTLYIRSRSAEPVRIMAVNR